MIGEPCVTVCINLYRVDLAVARGLLPLVRQQKNAAECGAFLKRVCLLGGGVSAPIIRRELGEVPWAQKGEPRDSFCLACSLQEKQVGHKAANSQDIDPDYRISVCLILVHVYHPLTVVFSILMRLHIETTQRDKRFKKSNTALQICKACLIPSLEVVVWVRVFLPALLFFLFISLFWQECL